MCNSHTISDDDDGDGDGDGNGNGNGNVINIITIGSIGNDGK